MKLRRFDLAEEALKRALSIEPIDVNALLSYGNVLGYRGDFQRALKFYEKARVLDSNNPMTWSCLAVAYADLRKWEEASDAINKALSFRLAAPGQRELFERVQSEIEGHVARTYHR